MTIPTSDELINIQNKEAARALLKWYIKLGKERGWLDKEGEK
jgi:hypothetical protein